MNKKFELLVLFYVIVVLFLRRLVFGFILILIGFIVVAGACSYGSTWRYTDDIMAEGDSWAFDKLWMN